MHRTTGHYEESVAMGEVVQAFVPHPLPPTDPPLHLDAALAHRLAQAEEKLRLLDLAGDLVPSVDWFVYAFVRKEAVLSAQIEGTQATLLDLLRAETSEAPPDDADVEEVCGYVDALGYAWSQLEDAEGLPLCARLLHQTHRRLLAGSRGATKQPGELRRAQNWIGGPRPSQAAFVPPPPHRLPELLAQLERAIHDPSDLHPLVRAGLVHVQFETLHPYLDGNGRLGRLLIPLLLREWGLLSQPLLYLSLYFKQHRPTYYQLLNGVRADGDWEAWLAFFLEGIATVAAEAAATARSLHAIVTTHRERLLGRDDVTVASIRLFELLPDHPVVTPNRAMSLLSVSRPTALKALGVLEAAGIVGPVEGPTRNRALGFEAYLTVLRVGTELGG